MEGWTSSFSFDIEHRGPSGLGNKDGYDDNGIDDNDGMNKRPKLRSLGIRQLVLAVVKSTSIDRFDNAGITKNAKLLHTVNYTFKNNSQVFPTRTTSFNFSSEDLRNPSSHLFPTINSSC